MTKEKRGYIVALSILFLWALVMFSIQPVRVARPLVQWELSRPGSDVPVPNRGYVGNFSYGSVRTDAAGNFYYLARRENTLNIVAADKDGKEIRRFPLHRKDGRPIRKINHDLAVNQAGTRFWIFRRPIEDMVGRYRWSIPYRIIAVYDASGKLIQEWKFPGMDQATALQAVGDDSAYLGHEGSTHTSIYRIGANQPRVVDLYVMYHDYLNSQGQVWSMELRNETQVSSDSQSQEYAIYLKEPGRKPREMFIVTKSPFQRVKEIFWQSENSGVYFSTYRSDKDGSFSATSWPLIYRVSPRGIELVFDSGKYLARIDGKNGKRYKAGKIVKADSAGTVWMEIMQFDGFEKTRTYGIIKFQTLPRWRSWRQ